MIKTLIAFILVFFCTVVTFETVGQIPNSIPKEGLTGFWSLAGNAFDSSEHNYHGHMIGSPIPVKDRFGREGEAMSFTDNTSAIIIADSTFGPFYSDFTLTFWFKSEGQKRMEPFVIGDSTGYNYNLNFAFNNLAGCWAYWNSGGYIGTKIGREREFTDGRWHNLLILRRDYQTLIYIDGTLSGTYNDFVAPIGNHDNIILNNPEHPWVGSLDDLIIYKRALSDIEIKAVTNYPAITFLSPSAHDEFPINHNTTITWLKPYNIGSTKLEYSIDSGRTWALTSSHLDSTVRSVTWTVPPLPGHSCLLKLTDLNNDQNFGVSDTFLISPYQWELVSDKANFSIRDGAGAITLNNQMFLIGGWNPADPITYPHATNNEVWQSVDGLNWSLLTVAPWEPRHTFGSLVFNNKMWVLGGDQLQCGFQKDIWNSPDGITWNLVTDEAPWGDRMLHIAFVFNGKMWVMGGQKIIYCDNDEEIVYNDIWYSDDGINWTKASEAAEWSPRGMIEGSFIFDNKVWLLGGGIYQKKYYNDVWNSEDGIHWKLVDDEAPWEGRQYSSVTIYDNAIWVIGGRGPSSDRNDVWHTKDGVKWYNLQGTPWPIRHAASTFNYQNSLWITSGFLHNDVWRLKPIPCPPLTLQPQDVEVSEGESINISASYLTSQSSFKWQGNINGEWTDLEDGEILSGTFTSSLNVISAPTSLNNILFRALVKDGQCTDTTQAVSIKVCPNIIYQPQDQGLDINASGAIFTKTTSINTSFQWQKKQQDAWINLADDAFMSGTKSDSLTFLATAELDSSIVRCLVSNEVCSTSSEEAIIVLCPLIETQPSDQLAPAGDPVEFKILVDKTSTEFQWQMFDGESWHDMQDNLGINGTKSSTLMLEGLQPFQDGLMFRCLIRRGNCVKYSEPAMAKISCMYENRVDTTHEATVYLGDKITAHLSEVDPDLTYYWEVGEQGIWLQDPSIFSGHQNNVYFIEGLTADKSGKEFRLIGVDINGCKSIFYHVTVNICVQLEEYSTSVTTNEGQTASLWVKYPLQDASFQWQIQVDSVWKDVIEGDLFKGTNNDSLKIFALDTQLNNTYFRCVILKGTCIESSPPLLLSVCPIIKNQPLPQIASIGDKASFEIDGAKTANYQWQRYTSMGWVDIVDQSGISGASSKLLAFDSVSSTEMGIRCIMSFEQCPKNISDSVSLIMCPSIDTVMNSASTTSGDTLHLFFNVKGATTLLWQLKYNDEYIDLEESTIFQGTRTDTLIIAGVEETLTGAAFRLTARNEHCHIVSSPVTLNVSPNQPCVVITQHPIDQTVPIDSIATFSVEFEGAVSGFLWQTKIDGIWVDLIDNSHFYGSSTNELTVRNIQLQDDGQNFRCLISDLCQTTSEVAHLYVAHVTSIDLSFNISIFPNPTSKTLNVNNDGSLPRRFKLFSPLGHCVMEGELKTGYNELPIGELAPGYYLVYIEGLKESKKLFITE